MVGLDDGQVHSECFDAFAAPTRDLRRVARETSATDKTRTLASIIEVEIIPRLLLANGGDEIQAARPSASIDVDSQDIDDFADMMVRLEMSRAQAVVSGAMARGVALDTILLEVLAPTARRLGDRWVDDRCTFTDVTVGLCGLQSLLRACEAGFDADIPTGPANGCALLAALPGEQHTFGVLMLESFYRRAGWDVVGMPLATEEEILSAVSRRPFAIVGFSLSREHELPRMRALVAAVRKRSRNQGVMVMVGGRVFNETPALVKQVGADITAVDGRGAVIASQHVLWSTDQRH